MPDIGGTVVEDSEDFLYLDDEEGDSPSKKPASSKITLPKIAIPKRKTTKNTKPIEKTSEEPPDSEAIEISLDGIFQFDWGIRGMDCPDCAMKASRAVNRLPGIQSCKISVADGTVEISQDISDGTVSRASSVLSSLGHEPDIGWLRAVGAKPEQIALRLGLDNKGLKNSILGIPGTLDARTDKGHIDVQRVWISDPELRTASERKMIEILGEGHILSPVRESGFRKDQIQLLAAVLTIPLIMLVALIESSETIPQLVAWAISLGGVAFAGNQLFKEAIAGLRNRVVGFQVLTSLAVLGAIALGELVEALMVVSLVAFASHLENRALIRARQSMQGGLDRLPRRARVITTDKPMETGATRSLNVINAVALDPSSVSDCDNDLVPVEALEVGEMIEVRSGETVPVDGVIVEGTGAIDRAPLTGEPIPIPVKVGDRVEAGLVLTRGPLVIKSEATGDGTRLSSLIDLVRHYKDQPTRTQSVIERFTLVWTPLVVFASPIIGFLFTSSTEQAILTTLLLWVVSCPCSLLLASPVPHAAALTTASGFGLIARGGDVLESAAEVKLALLDKTGTLTSGRPTISGISVASGEDESRVLRIAAGLEARSNHPYARTIIQEAEKRSLRPMSVTKIEDGDAGVLGVHRGDSVMLGRADWLRSQQVSISSEINEALEESRIAGKGASVLSVDGSAVAVISFAHDDAREGVLETINELDNHGVKVEILSGDEQASVEAFALEIGIDPSLCKGGVDPEGKAEYVTHMSAANRTMMAGDGFNDAGALAAADIGVAVGSGDQVNLDAADVLIPGQDPRVLSRMVGLAKRTRRIVYVNIAISVMVTMILVTAVLSGIEINLAAGIALHEASAIIIILNGMWVSGSGSQRLSSLVDLGRDIFSDITEIWAILSGKNDEDTSATA
ncbi:MAG: cation-translocating P-type ATPase [Candidatus Thermoplasmatota archaeon]|nr:cation-translocating P-type ATPase [Candidatus Thermoplasmatota archaeon]